MALGPNSVKCVIRWEVAFCTGRGLSLEIRSQRRSGHEETVRSVTGQSCRVSQLGNRNRNCYLLATTVGIWVWSIALERMSMGSVERSVESR